VAVSNAFSITVQDIAEEAVLATGGGDDAWLYQGRAPKQKDYRPELDERRRKDEQDLRRLLEQAAGIIEIVQAAEPQKPLAAQAAQIERLRESQIADPELVRVQTIAVLTRTLEQMSGEIYESIAESVLDLVIDSLIDLIEEITDEARE
jgi:hypothetical protein